MKKKHLRILCIICLILAFTPVVSYANPNEEKEVLEPNIYEKREINIRSKNRDNLIERKELPEEQMNLTFQNDTLTESEIILDELFQSAKVETNTITSKAAQMELFSLAEEEVSESKEDELIIEGPNILMIIMIIGVIVIVAMLFMIIPKLQHTQD